MKQPDIPYKCIIIDDEQNAIDVLAHYLVNYPQIIISGSFTNAIEANNFLKTESIDLMFLDIQMPGISGIDFLRSLKPIPPTFFTTAYRHYAPEAFELNVLDYLLKPISANRFRTAIEKFENHLKINKLSAEKPEDFIIVRANRSDIRIKPFDILFIEAKGDYLKIHLENNSLLTKETLKNFNTKLPSYFRQIHRSFIVNSRQINTQTSSSVIIRDCELPVSRNFR